MGGAASKTQYKLQQRGEGSARLLVPRRKVQQGLRMQCTSKARIQRDAG